MHSQAELSDGLPLYTAQMRNLAVFVLLALPVAAQEPIDLGTVDRIKGEAFDHSKVMETLRLLSDVHGLRLTGSPGFEEAAR
jgi:carboxypeptidase Q